MNDAKRMGQRAAVVVVIVVALSFEVSAFAWGGDSGKILIANATQTIDQVFTIADDGILYA